MVKITVLDNEITILKVEDEDYISLTDMAGLMLIKILLLSLLL